MRIFIKTLVLLVCCVAAIAAGGFTYLMLGYPKVGPAPDVTIERTSERIARGKYLADHVAACTDCHSQRDWARYAGPVKDGTYGAGGEVFDESMGMPGRVVSRNITPGALGDWTDGEILRAMTAGVSRDGSPLFPLMPYLDYGAHMDPEDAKAIVSYLRTIPASSHAPEPTRLNFRFRSSCVRCRSSPRALRRDRRQTIVSRRAYSCRWPAARTATRRWMTAGSRCRDVRWPEARRSRSRMASWLARPT